MGTLVLVVGTGRCGSTSLSHLLSLQDGARVTHERYGHRVRWDCPSTLWPLRLWNDALIETESVVGDAAFYWTPHIEYFLRLGEKYNRDVRIVGLVRPRDEVIASYCRWVGEKNHWTYHNGEEWEFDRWDHCYPVFRGKTREEAIGLFWDRVMSKLQTVGYKEDRIDLFEMRELNNEIGVRAILNHIGIPKEDQNIEIEVRKNAGPEHA